MTYFDSNVKCNFLDQEAETLLIVELQTSLDIFQWVKENNVLLEEYLRKHGGVLLRNFGIYSVSEFNRVVQIISPNLLDYVYRSTPRTKLGGKIYTATEYPAHKAIPLHNENSYTKSWPSKIFFFSIMVAPEGGETPLASSRAIYNQINVSVREKFEKNGIMYVRNYTPGVDLSWQDVFQTSSKEEVNSFCKEHDIQFQWNKVGPELTTRQIAQATLQHPDTDEWVWFNQAHLFHASALEESERLSLIRELGENNIPRNTFYGNGNPIEAEVLDHIRAIYNKEKIKFKWHKGDIMILDNILSAHGREPFKGERKVAVAMA